MKALNNDGLVTGLCGGCNCPGFDPKVSFVYDAGAKTVTITDETTFPDGDGLKRINAIVHDEFGNQKSGTIAVAAGNTGALDVSGLNPAKGLHITATVITNNGCDSDGSIRNIGEAGELTNWSKNYIPEVKA